MPSSSSVVTRSLLYGVLVAIAFFLIYGPLTRPKVPTPVANAITTFVPGLAIAKPVRDMKGIPAPYWMPNLGFVSDVDRPGLVQVRLLVSPQAAAEARGDTHANVDAVEIVGQPGVFSQSHQMAALAARFGTRQEDGCLVPQRAGMPRRSVAYWKTKNDRGGMAVLLDYRRVDEDSARRAHTLDSLRLQRELELAGKGAGPQPRYMPPAKPFALASVIFWAGKFDGSKTLRGNFIAQSCDELSEAPGAPRALLPTIVAVESLFVQLGYRP